MNFKLDENLPADLATWLRAEGHDVQDVVAEGLGGEDDPPVLAAAAAESRILLTFDLDFADIRHYPPGTHAGIVVFRLQDQRWKTLQAPAERLLTEGHLKNLENGLAIVDETRVRCKRAKKKATKRPGTLREGPESALLTGWSASTYASAEFRR